MCNKAVYANDPHISLDGHKYHKACAKCTDCGCNITLSNFTKCDTVLYCKTHYFKKFHEEGSYLGGHKYENKNPRDTKGGGVAIPTPVISSASTTAAGVAADSDSSSVKTSSEGKPPLPPKLVCDEDMNTDLNLHPIITEEGIPITRQLTPAVEANENLNFGPQLDQDAQPLTGLARQVTPTFPGDGIKNKYLYIFLDLSCPCIYI